MPIANRGDGRRRGRDCDIHIHHLLSDTSDRDGTADPVHAGTPASQSSGHSPGCWSTVIQAIALFYMAWFVVFYILAVSNRRRTPIHSRYMLATALTLLGPTVDRIFVFGFKLQALPGSMPIESVAFVIADAVLITLLLKDYKHGRPTSALWTCLLIYLSGQLLFFILPSMNWWQPFVTFIMKPEA
jgi:hypothetical protein